MFLCICWLVLFERAWKQNNWEQLDFKFIQQFTAAKGKMPQLYNPS